MLEYLGAGREASASEAAVQGAVTARQGTADIGGGLGTRETGDCVAAAIRRARA
jgi:isocitrate/isopropylmalate dehydrogenase